MKQELVLALSLVALVVVALAYNTRSMIQNNIDPSIERAIKKYGYAVVYTVATGKDNCLYSIGELCINKYNVTSMDQVYELRKKYTSVWAYYTSDGEELKAKISLHSLKTLALSQVATTDTKFKTGLKPIPPSNTTIAIIDTGIDYTHPDLPKPVYYVSTAFETVIEASNENVAQIDNECYNQTQHYCFYDEHGHGTFVAGIISADGVVKGITPGAKILVIKAFIRETTTIDAILLALEWIYINAEKYNITVVNGSWGIPGATTGTDPISLIIDKLYTDKKIITVVSAGNGGLIPHSIEIPSGARYVISVGAFNPINWKPAKFTSCGSTANNLVRPDICAPGVSVVSTLPGGYGVGSGTSFSAPIITAVVSTLSTRDRSEIESILSRQVIYKIVKEEKDNICGWGSI